MAVNTYLTFFDDAEGESGAVGHEQWIELRSWNWAVTSTVPAHAGLGGGAGAGVGTGAGVATPTALRWEHGFDASSTRLLGFVASGRRLAKAELHVTRGGGHSGRDAWLAVIMRDLVITSVSTSGASDGSVAQEVAMDFRSMTVEYRRQLHTGSLATPATFEWDIATGVSSTSP